MDEVCHNLNTNAPTVTTDLLAIPMNTTRTSKLPELVKKIDSEIAEEPRVLKMMDKHLHIINIRVRTLIN